MTDRLNVMARYEAYENHPQYGRALFKTMVFYRLTNGKVELDISCADEVPYKEDRRGEVMTEKLSRLWMRGIKAGLHDPYGDYMEPLKRVI